MRYLVAFYWCYLFYGDCDDPIQAVHDNEQSQVQLHHQIFCCAAL